MKTKFGILEFTTVEPGVSKELMEARKDASGDDRAAVGLGEDVHQ